ncbi:isoprenylcysteine carboxylmethyltransferase family protein [Acidobacteriia bacterium AH_259_A11_L15]|nr:isoprenylcysteine carboxylmethyltransferase family protein [Acidobacteriia bacterium AH_259_A11_L15]
MGRALALVYGVLCYLIFLASFGFGLWFVWTMDRPQPEAPLGRALLINAGLLLLFALQHSVMARQGFKRYWTRVVPLALERSTYVLAASLALLALCSFWQPMPGVIWNFEAAWARILLHAFFWLGWLQVLVATFILDHFHLFGLKQAWAHFRNRPYQPPVFRTPAMYKFVRHPIYVGFLILFWSTPRMTLGHLILAVVVVAYILLGIHLEERDLLNLHGETYRRYRRGVSMLIPWPPRKTPS